MNDPSRYFFLAEGPRDANLIDQPWRVIEYILLRYAMPNGNHDLLLLENFSRED